MPQRWSYSTSEAEEIKAEVSPYWIGFATIAPAMQKVTGRMVINYPRRHGQYEWYACPTLTQYDPDEMQYATGQRWRRRPGRPLTWRRRC